MKKINWPDLIIKSELHHLPFEDVNIITLKSYYQQAIDNNVIDNMFTNEMDADALAEKVRASSKIIMDSGIIHCREFIEYHPNSGVTICIDVEEITEDAIIQALDLLMKPEYDWREGMYEFGPPKTFKSYQLRTYG